MTARVDFYFDVVCPYAYLAHTQIEALVAEAGATLHWKPILLGGLFKTIGVSGDGPMASMPPSKARLNDLDMERWAAHWDVPLNRPAEHPRRSVLAMRTVVASDDRPRAAKALFAAYWRDGKDVSQPDVVAAVLTEAGLPGAALVTAASDQATKDELRSRTDEAAEAGAFGVPTFVVTRPDAQPQLVWGQDRLPFVTLALEGKLAEAPR